MNNKIYISNSNGTNIEFTKAFGLTGLPSIPGVYALLKSNWFSHDVQILYIGEAMSLHDRLELDLKNHDGYQRAALQGMNTIAYHHVPGIESKRKQLESELISFHQHRVICRENAGHFTTCLLRILSAVR